MICSKCNHVFENELGVYTKCPACGAELSPTWQAEASIAPAAVESAATGEAVSKLDTETSHSEASAQGESSLPARC